jgi:hypothetical protein
MHRIVVLYLLLIVSVLISGFRRDVFEICGLLGYYTTPCNNPEDHEFISVLFRVLLRGDVVLATTAKLLEEGLEACSL